MSLINNIYHMLSYTFDTLNNKCYSKCGEEEYKNLNDLFSSILIKGIKTQMKRGLIREYNSVEDVTHNLRGRIDIAQTINSNFTVSQKVVCSYDELTINSKPNQIIKATLNLLIKSDINLKLKREMKSILKSFKEVKNINANKIDWNIHFNSSNKTYKMLLTICNLVVYGLEGDNNSSLIENFFDKENMTILFKQFTIEYYKRHYKLYRMLSPKIEWNVQFSNGSLETENALFQPMKADIFISNYEKKVIVLTKFESEIISNENKEQVISNDIYLLYSMINNLDNNKDIVSGAILYGVTQRGIKDQEVVIGKTKIAIKFIDLNLGISQIKKQLDDVTRFLD